MSHASTTTPELERMTATLDDDVLFEIVDGEIQEKPRMGAGEALIATKLTVCLGSSPTSQTVGRVAVETLFRLSPEGPQRRPDVAFVSFERWPKGQPVLFENAWDVVPDLAVEIISRTNLADEIPTRVREYFEAGVRRVWIAFPRERLVYEYDVPTKIHVLMATDALDGGPVVPGFRLPLAELFGETGPTP